MAPKWVYFVRFNFKPIASQFSSSRSIVIEVPYQVASKDSFLLLKESVKKDQGFDPRIVDVDIMLLQLLSTASSAAKLKNKKQAYTRPNTL
jgi:hypothetical protein